LLARSLRDESAGVSEAWCRDKGDDRQIGLPQEIHVKHFELFSLAVGVMTPNLLL
jgi:hypothetical protein